MRRKKKIRGKKKIFKIKTIATGPPVLTRTKSQVTLETLQDSIVCIQEKRTCKATLEELYQHCSDYCITTQGKHELYIYLKNKCEKFTQNNVRSLRRQTSEPKQFLWLVNKMWQDHKSIQTTLSNVFTVLDRNYILTETDSKSIYHIGLNVLRHELDTCPEVQTKIHNFITLLIKRERDRQQIDRNLIRELTRMLISTETYGFFEKTYLEQSRNYYKDEGARMLSTLRITDFLEKISTRIQEEVLRCDSILDSCTKPLITIVILDQCLKLNADAIMNQGLENLLNSKDLPSLAQFYALFKRIEKVPDIVLRTRSWLEKVGADLVIKHISNTKDFIQNLLDLLKFTKNVVSGSFDADETFNRPLTNAWEKVMNTVKDKPAAIICEHLDRMLREGASGSGEDEFRKEIDSVMTLFHYVNGQDIFKAFYAKYLAKRLLLKKSASIALEKEMVGRINRQCGKEFSDRLDKMFFDIESSRDVLKTYNKEFPTITSEGIVLDTQLLTASIWPHDPEEFELSIPKSVVEKLDHFGTWYTQYQKGRRIKWLHGFSHCIIKGNFQKGARKLVLSAYQGVIILAFNDKNIMSYEELIETTKLPEEILSASLASLMKTRAKLILKKPKGLPCKKGDKFRVNKNFQHQNILVKLNSIQIKDTIKDKQRTTQSVFRDRKTTIQAAIVRIMKAKKEMKHHELVADTFAQLKFPCDAKKINDQISTLIDKDYLERDLDDSRTYLYKA